MIRDLDRGQQRIQELAAILNQNIAQQKRVDTLVEMAWELRMSQPEQAYAISEQSSRLSQSGEFESRHYTRGLAGSLINMAFVETYAGKLDGAVSKCLDAINLLSQESPSARLVDAWYTLSWNSFFLGDYPSALEHAHKALKISQELGLKLHEAWALDAIASINGSSQDFAAALQAHQSALSLFRELNDHNGELRSLNNLAYTYYLMKNYPAALDEGLRSLQLARRLNSGYQAFNICCTVAQILIDMHEWDQAETYLREALSGLDEFGPTNVTRVYVLMEWGRLFLMKNDLQTAESYLQKALALAEQTERLSEQALCHQRLSEVYEQLGQYIKALEQYKAFHALNESLTGEQSAKRLAVLNITYQVESARHEKEIYRLQAIQYQHEIEEQKSVQNILENMSRVDSLTGLYNRRYFDERLEEECARHARSGAELSLIMLDIDHFKAFNDTYGHIKGDDCLQRIAQVIKHAAFRPSDFTARYGGEEFLCILPETNAKGALVVAKKIQQEIIDLAISHSASNTADVVTVSIGAISARHGQGCSITELLTRVDEQLYKAKSNGRNRIEVASKLD